MLCNSNQLYTLWSIYNGAANQWADDVNKDKLKLHHVLKLHKLGHLIN